MRLIATRQGRSDKYDELRCLRRDGSAMPWHGALELELPES
jgi:hypothetical protein